MFEDNHKYWFYKGSIIESIDQMPDNTYGFIYLISLRLDGKEYKYVGKKQLFSVNKKKLTYKEQRELKDKRASKFKYVTKEMNWRDYTSSSRQIKEFIEMYGIENLNFRKEILTFCFSDLELKYREVQEIICRDAMLDKFYLNDGVSFRQIGKINLDI